MALCWWNNKNRQPFENRENRHVNKNQIRINRLTRNWLSRQYFLTLEFYTVRNEIMVFVFPYCVLCMFILFDDVDVSCVLDRLSLHRNRMNDNHEKVWIFVWSIGMSHTLRGLFYNHIDTYFSNVETGTEWMRKRTQWNAAVFETNISGGDSDQHKKKMKCILCHMWSILYLFSWRICPKPIINYVDSSARCSMLIIATYASYINHVGNCPLFVWRLNKWQKTYHRIESVFISSP